MAGLVVEAPAALAVLVVEVPEALAGLVVEAPEALAGLVVGVPEALAGLVVGVPGALVAVDQALVKLVEVAFVVVEACLLTFPQAHQSRLPILPVVKQIAVVLVSFAVVVVEA